MVANLTLITSSPFATTQDALGSPYQTVINATGSRLYTHLATGATVTSTITGLSSSSAPSPSQRFYPYSLLAAAPNVYSTTSAPFFDAAGLGFAFSPAAPESGLPPGSGTQYGARTIRVLSTETATALTEPWYTALPDPRLQQQTYSIWGPEAASTRRSA